MSIQQLVRNVLIIGSVCGALALIKISIDSSVGNGPTTILCICSLPVMSDFPVWVYLLSGRPYRNGDTWFFCLIPNSAAVVLVPNNGSVKDSIWELKISPRPPHLVISLIRLIACSAPHCSYLLQHQELAPYTRVIASCVGISALHMSAAAGSTLSRILIISLTSLLLDYGFVQSMPFFSKFLTWSSTVC